MPSTIEIFRRELIWELIDDCVNQYPHSLFYGLLMFAESINDLFVISMNGVICKFYLTRLPYR